MNGLFGIAIGLGLWAIGIPSPILWGISAAVLRFVPYIGAVIAAAFPLILAVAVDPDWSTLLWTAALFIVVEPLVGHCIEPLVYGRSTGLSPVAVVVAATFWTALWGPIGLVLATPLTVCLVVLGRHVEKLQFLDVMFGDRPALTPPEIFYQRMLPGDPAEAAEKAEQFLKERSLVSYYDQVALQGLRLAQSDANRGALLAERQSKLRDAVREFVADLDDIDEEDKDENPTTDAEAVMAVEASPEEGDAERMPVLRGVDFSPGWTGDHPVLCVAGRSALDEAAALMMAHLASVHGIAARSEAADALAPLNIFRLQTDGLKAVCLVYMGDEVLSHTRFAVRRLRRKVPTARIVFCCWSNELDGATLERKRVEVKADLAASSPARTLALLLKEAQASTGNMEPVQAEPLALAN